MKRAFIIVAGGKGERMGGALPKQFLPLHGKPLLMHTLAKCHSWDSEADLLVVIPQAHCDYWRMLCREIGCSIPHTVVYGGANRFESVRNGLQATDCDGLIAVHDGVRPFVSLDVITACFEAAVAFGAAIPVMPLTETVRLLTDDGGSRTFDRSCLRSVQTPQVFAASLLRQAYLLPYCADFTDDASVVESIGATIGLVRGNPENIKITTPTDLLFARAFLSQ